MLEEQKVIGEIRCDERGKLQKKINMTEFWRNVRNDYNDVIDLIDLIDLINLNDLDHLNNLFDLIVLANYSESS